MSFWVVCTSTISKLDDIISNMLNVKSRLHYLNNDIMLVLWCLNYYFIRTYIFKHVLKMTFTVVFLASFKYYKKFLASFKDYKIMFSYEIRV